MLSRIDLRGRKPAADAVRPELAAAMLPRAALDVGAALEAVRPVCEDVRQPRRRRGPRVHRPVRRRRPGQHPGARPRRCADALAALDPAVRAALQRGRPPGAARARGPGARRDRSPPSPPGSTVTERYVPVRRAGVYVPGGLVAYPSSVVMNVIPAQVAGRQRDRGRVAAQAEHGGLPHPAVLAACALFGITEVHAAGGAQAIAMFAYGTEDCAPADVITGPGNVYVAAAKRLLRERVGIDAEAGPTEIAIIADDTADPAFVAADLVAQAEHDPLAACLLITTDARRWPTGWTPAGRPGGGAPGTGSGSQTALAGQSACVLVDDIDAALAVVGRLGARAPGDPDRATRRRGPPGPQRRRDLRRPVRPGVARRLPGRVQPRAAHRRHRAAHRRPVARCRSCAASTWSSTTGPRWPRSPRTSTPWAAPRTWPPTSKPSARGCPDGAERDRGPVAAT